jgi:hypothetical protein
MIRSHSAWKSNHYRLTRKRILAAVCILLIAVSLQGADFAKPKREGSPAEASPSGTLEPNGQARLLAMLAQVIMQLEHYVRSKDLAGIHNEDVILSAAATELLGQAESIAPQKTKEFKINLTTLCSRVSALHLAADLNQQTNSETALGKVQEAFVALKGNFSKETVGLAQPYLETFTCPMHRDVVGKPSEFCPKCGMPLDQLARILPAGPSFPQPGQESVRASIRTSAPLVVGEPVTAILELGRPNGEDISPSDLIETHTKKIHLLIIDGSLTDYHHEHPEPTRNPGEYSFSFTPSKPGGYRAWADVRTSPLGLQEYAMTDIPAKTTGEPLTDRAPIFRTTVDDLNYELILPQKTIQVARPVVARLKVTTKDGKGFNQLEPLMGTFAHIVGFNQDYKTVMHIHPKGPPVLDPAARGGPELEFQIYALRPGFVRLFAQVQIAGRSQFAPFGIQVVP